MLNVLVLGSGQLGRMMAQSGSRIGVHVDRLGDTSYRIYTSTCNIPSEPSVQPRLVTYDYITVEKEYFEPDSIGAGLFSRAVSSNTIMLVANRVDQKRLLDDIKIPQAEWSMGAKTDSIIKAAQGGYDGRGQWREVNLVPDNVEVISERRINFSHELSIVGARNAKGNCVFYPLVENVHDSGILINTYFVRNKFSEYQDQAESILRKIMESLDYRGVMTAELFLEDGHLLVNEIAARVHNSGHWTQDGCDIDQFELHLRAICELPIRTPYVTADSVTMTNLLGNSFSSDWLQVPNSRLHWYDKNLDAQKPNRKMGHINTVRRS